MGIGSRPRLHIAGKSLFAACPPPCKGVLELDEMMAYKAEGMPKIRCSVCGRFHEIDSLMAAVAPKPEWQDAVIQLQRGQRRILAAVDGGCDSLSVQLRTLMSQADEQFDTFGRKNDPFCPLSANRKKRTANSPTANPTHQRNLPEISLRSGSAPKTGISMYRAA